MKSQDTHESGHAAPVPVILSFNLNDARLSALKKLCENLQIRLKAVPRESFTLPLGGMAGIPVSQPVASPASGTTFDDPMLVMCHLDEPRFNAFLQGLRCSGLPPIPLKAVLTPYNVGWNALQLHEELSREHAEMQRARKR